MAKDKNEELPGVTGKGVSPLCIKAIDKAIDDYQSAKDKRCKESPKEIAAKTVLLEVLHKHREELPNDEDGIPCYRYEDRIYRLTETVSITKVHDDSDEG